MILELGRRVAALSLDDLTAAARDRLTLALLANLSVGIAGPRYAVVPEPKGEGPYRLLSGRTTARADDAAFYNGAAMHARTQDDFDPVGKLHTGTVALPGLLTEADKGSLSGRDFLAGVAAGYMIASGLSRGPSAETSVRGLRATAIYAPFGAVAAVARARLVSADQAASALALTTGLVGGTNQAWLDGSHEWQLHAAQGARAGVVANDLAAAGMRGGAHALDGPFGFYRANLGRDVTLKDLEAGLDPSRALEENAIKRYPVSGSCQSIVLAAERAARKVQGGAQNIRRVQVVMNPAEMRYPGHVNKGPFQGFGDKLMSAEFCSASVLAHGRFIFDDFHTGEHAARDRLVSLTEVSEDQALPIMSCRVIVTTDNGAITEQVINSRAEVAIDWTSIDAWAGAIWEEVGRSRADYAACRDAVRQLEHAKVAHIPL